MSDPTGTHAELLARLRAIVGAPAVLTEAADVEPHVVDWRRRERGAALAVVRPASSAEVAAVVAACAASGTAIVPQGGNTGQCAAAIPSKDGGQIVLSLGRMNRIRAVDAANNTIELEAGCILAHVQQAAAGVDRLFPLSLGAEGSCQIGGNLSTNAGGNAVLRYGNTRDLVLGLEVVLPDGTIWSGLKSLRKDNTGYDLKQLFIGAEGSLGVITAAVVKLFPRPRSVATAFLAVRDPAAAVELLNRLRVECGDRLTGLEIISRRCLDIVLKNLPQFSHPLRERHEWYLLAELADTMTGPAMRDAMERVLEAAMADALVLDAVIAESETQARNLWRMREELPEGLRREAAWVRHDVSVPVSRVPEFIDRASAALERRFAGVRIVAFGHIGDGNIHFNATGPEGAAEQITARAAEVYATVHDIVVAMGGSFSAEHGIGLLKVDEMQRYKSPVELALMRKLKHALDPQGIMNPGKVFRTKDSQ